MTGDGRESAADAGAETPTEIETHGTFRPDSWRDAEDRYASLAPTARTVAREIARAMEFDRDEYEKRMTPDVVETARRTLFAETLAVRVASRGTFDAWCEAYSGELRIAGSDAVDRVAWHVSPAGTAVAATFQNEPDAAIGTVRRMAFNRLYRDRMDRVETP